MHKSLLLTNLAVFCLGWHTLPGSIGADCTVGVDCINSSSIDLADSARPAAGLDQPAAKSAKKHKHAWRGEKHVFILGGDEALIM